MSTFTDEPKKRKKPDLSYLTDIVKSAKQIINSTNTSKKKLKITDLTGDSDLTNESAIVPQDEPIRTEPILGMGDLKQAESEDQPPLFFDQKRPVRMNDLFDIPRESTKAPEYDYKQLEEQPILKKIYKERSKDPRNKEPLYPLATAEETSSGTIVSSDINPQLQQQENEQKTEILKKISSGEIHLPAWVGILPDDQKLQWVGATYNNNPVYTAIATLQEPLIHLENIIRTGADKVFDTKLGTMQAPELTSENEDDKLVEHGVTLGASLVPLGASIKGANLLLKGISNPFIRHMLSSGVGFLINSQPELLDNLTQGKIELKDYAIQNAVDFGTGLSFGFMPPGSPLKYEIPYQAIVPTMVPVLADVLQGKELDEKTIIEGVITNTILGLAMNGSLPKNTPVKEISKKVKTELSKYTEEQQTPELVNEVIAGLLPPASLRNSETIPVVKPGETKTIKKEAGKLGNLLGKKDSEITVTTKPTIEQVTIPGDKSRIIVDENGNARLIEEKNAEDLLLSKSDIELQRDYGMTPEEIKAAQDKLKKPVFPQKTGIENIPAIPTETVTAIDDLAGRIKKGDTNFTAEDLQLQRNYPKEIETRLEDLNKKEEANKPKKIPGVTLTADPKAEIELKNEEARLDDDLKNKYNKEKIPEITNPILLNTLSESIKARVQDFNKAIREHNQQFEKPPITDGRVDQLKAVNERINEMMEESKTAGKNEQRKISERVERLQEQRDLLVKGMKEDGIEYSVTENVKNVTHEVKNNTPVEKKIPSENIKTETKPVKEVKTEDLFQNRKNIFEKMTLPQLEKHINDKVKEFGSRVDYLQSAEYKEIIKPLHDKLLNRNIAEVKKQIDYEKGRLKNKVITKSAYDKAVKNIKDRSKNMYSNPLDPGAIKDLATAGLYYFERGVRSFEGWSKRMVRELGDKIKPHLKTAWNSMMNNYIEKKSENREIYKNKNGNEITFTDTTFSEDNNGNGPSSGRNNNRQSQRFALRKLAPGEEASIERRYKSFKQIKFFSSKEKVESPQDVAYIFNQLQSEGVEHLFALHITETGQAIVQHLSTGTVNKAVLNMNSLHDMISRAGTKKLHIIHNHPSGEIIASSNDYQALNSVKKALPEGVELGEGIILNVKDGKYGVFNWDDLINDPTPKFTSGKNNFKLNPVTFSTQIFKEDVIFPSLKDLSLQSISEFVSAARFSTGDKFQLLVIRNNGDITARLQMTNKISDSNNFADEINTYVSKYGGTGAILAGNKMADPSMIVHLNKINERVKAAEVNLSNYIAVDNGLPIDLKNFTEAEHKQTVFSENTLKLKNEDEAYSEWAKRVAKKYAVVPTREEYNDAKELFKTSKIVEEKKTREPADQEKVKSELVDVLDSMRSTADRTKTSTPTPEEEIAKYNARKKKAAETKNYIDKAIGKLPDIENKIQTLSKNEYDSQELVIQQMKKEIFNDENFKKLDTNQKKRVIKAVKSYYKERNKNALGLDNALGIEYKETLWHKAWKRSVLQANNVVAKMGEAGKEMAKRFNKMSDEERKHMGIPSAMVLDLAKLSGAEYKNLTEIRNWKRNAPTLTAKETKTKTGPAKDTVQNKVKLPAFLNDNVKRANELLDNYYDGVAKEFEDRGFTTKNKNTGEEYMFTPRREYEPRVINIEMDKFGVTYDKLGRPIHNIHREKVIEYLVETGQAKNPAAAAYLLDNYLAESRINRAGNIEYSRTFDFPPEYYLQDPVEVMIKYATRIAKRLAFTDSFGKEGDIADNLINEIRSNKQDYKFVQDLYRYETGNLNASERQVLEYVNIAKALQAMTKFTPFTTLRNSFQGFLGSTTRGNLKAGITGFVNAFKLEMKREAYLSGALGDNIESIIKKSVGGDGQNLIGKATSKYLNIIGFTASDRFNRVISSAAGITFYEDMLKRIAKDSILKRRAFREFEKIGLDSKEILSREDPKFTQEERNLIMRTFSGDAQFNIRPHDLPLFWSSGVGKLVTQWKPFGYKMTQLLRDSIWKETKAGNLFPLFTMMTAYGVAGESVNFVIDNIRSILNFDPKKKDDDKSSFETAYDKTAYMQFKNGDMGGFVKRVIDDLAGLGAMTMMVDILRSFGWGKSGSVGVVAGPTLGELSMSADDLLRPTGELFKGEENNWMINTLKGIYSTASRNIPGAGLFRTFGINKAVKDMIFGDGDESNSVEFKKTLSDAEKESFDKMNDLEKARDKAKKKALDSKDKEDINEYNKLSKEVELARKKNALIIKKKSLYDEKRKKINEQILKGK